MNGRGGKASRGEGMEGEREGEAPLEKNKQQDPYVSWHSIAGCTSHLPGDEAAEGRGQAMNLTDSGKGWARVNKRPQASRARMNKRPA